MEEVLRRRSPWRRRRGGPGARPAAVGGAWGRRVVAVGRTREQAARAGAMVEKEEAGGGISEEEAAQYDRQIRLWGLEAQKRSGPERLVGLRVWRGRLARGVRGHHGAGGSNLKRGGGNYVPGEGGLLERTGGVGEGCFWKMWEAGASQGGG